MRGLVVRDRSVSSVIGIVLLVAMVVVVFGFAFLDGFGTPTAEASFAYDRTPAGLVMAPKALGTDVILQLNGETVETISADSAGQPVLLPTATTATHTAWSIISGTTVHQA